MKIICITNQKGGSGKTSFSVLVAMALAHQNKKVLAIDCDPQSGLTSFLSSEAFPDNKGIFDLLMEETPDIISVDRKGIKFDYISSSHKLDKLYSNIDHLSLKRALKLLNLDNYDYIIFDTPPTVQGITRACAFIADIIFIPADISKSTLYPTLYTLHALEEIEKKAKVILLGKDTDKGFDGKLLQQFKNNIKDFAFIPKNTTMKKAVDGQLSWTDKQVENVIKPILEAIE